MNFKELKAKDVAKTLKDYNDWRRGDDTIDHPSPKEIGEAIDYAIDILQKSIDDPRASMKLSESYNKIVDISLSMLPEDEAIIRLMYDMFYKKEIEECIIEHFGSLDEVDIYIYRYYENVLDLIFISNKIDVYESNDLFADITRILGKYEDKFVFNYKTVGKYDFRFESNLECLYLSNHDLFKMK